MRFVSIKYARHFEGKMHELLTAQHRSTSPHSVHKHLSALSFLQGVFLFVCLLCILCCTLCLSACSQKSNPAEGQLTVRFLDVGEGDCALISCNDHHLLIDGGPPDASRKLYAILQELHITHLDYIIASHPDADHIGGIPAALSIARCDTLFCSTANYESERFEDMVRLLRQKSAIGVSVPSVGSSFSLGNAQIRFVGPVRAFDAQDTNNNSLVCRIDFGDTSFLFTGDAETESLQSMIDSGAPLHADVLKISHHGSSNGSNVAFLSAVSPRIAVMSVGENNYGHPDQNVLDTLQNHSIELYRTDLCGTITIHSNGTALSVETQSTSQSNPYATNEANPAPEISENATFILNTSSRKIHYPECNSVAKIAEHNRMEFFGSYEEVCALGYTPCQICKPHA